MSYKPIAPAPTSSGAAGTSSSSASPAPGAPPVGKSPRLPARLLSSRARAAVAGWKPNRAEGYTAESPGVSGRP